MAYLRCKFFREPKKRGIRRRDIVRAGRHAYQHNCELNSRKTHERKLRKTGAERVAAGI
jgi:hypothetical protein